MEPIETTTKKIPVTVYAESTPNPASMKFVCSMMLLQEGVVEYHAPEEAGASPLAMNLFSFSGVKGVFISSNFITITKDSETDWYEVVNILREYIRGHLMSGEKVFVRNPFELDNQKAVNTPSEAGNSTADPTETEQQIIAMLDEYVKPAVEQDGGAIHFRSFSNGVVTVALKGACSGCPSSTLTLKSGIENLLKKMIPEVQEVIAEAE
ncbi:MAG TPA: NifU family protein [Bacteroidia bacterium]|nr:NifU family protein [Bacteroidia bacterium]